MLQWMVENIGFGWTVISWFTWQTLKLTLFSTYWCDRERINERIWRKILWSWFRLEEFVHRSKCDDWRLLKEDVRDGRRY